MRNSHPNSYLMPGFDPSQISDILEEQFLGDGGAIEQTGLYIHPSSSSRWSDVVSQAEYLATQAGAKYHEIANHINHYFLKNTKALDIFALGSGDGKNEIQLVQNLVTYDPEINLFLLDVSQPLLKRAYSYALAMLGLKYKDRVFTVLGNIHHLAQASYVDLYTPHLPGTRRLITMLGHTFGNLDSELLFVRHSLRGFAKADLLLLDICLTYAPANKPEEVKQKDPRLTNVHSSDREAAYQAFLSDTIYHYCRGVKEILFSQELDYGSCSVPGSYGITQRAHVRFMNGKERVFAMMQYKRYDINQLVEALGLEGWRNSNGWHYGPNYMMYLFEKYK